MKFLEQFKNVDWQDIGRWPFVVRASAVGVWLIAAVLVLGYLFVVNGQWPELDQERKRQDDLWQEFLRKQSKAANFDAYKAQLKEMEKSFGAMLRQLPGKTEVPSLLVDISQTGLAAGLDEKLFQPAPELKREFYAELPIKIRLTGNYHELGNFVSGIAALPRIVTLHDIEIKPAEKDSYDDLVLDVTAKTYRYLEDDESAAAAGPAKKKPGAPNTPPITLGR
ncbi:MAG TPA: type 4a pilus biogenesis protein PilO [Steroidobacteraceae bacterium]|nr:type 4a pilus biogenesis protein PilO [Steroidobacteraceae bacterium]